MATACPINFDVTSLRDQVRATYEQVARDPSADYHFHRGPEYAYRFLGYDPQELAQIPELSSARFAGVGNPLAIGQIETGATVLDHACGAGMHLLLAARRIGSSGRAIGSDMTQAMLDCASEAAQQAGLAGIAEFHLGFYEELPVDDACVDTVLSTASTTPARKRRLQNICSSSR
ncbi:MAG: methyltransferase domain-containing protein [Thiogranum sp.]|nr:methyltransferase domain-containing protein [Thiogranum sp.]